MREPNDYTHVAHTLGFLSEHHMFNSLYTEIGFSFSQIAKAVGCTKFVARQRCLDAGVVPRSQGGPRIQPTKLTLTAAQLFDGTAMEVAKRHNVHVTTVSRARERYRKENESDSRRPTEGLAEAQASVAEVEDVDGGSSHREGSWQQGPSQDD